ncbi:MAG: IPT/TIG domain-containing protein [Bacteroidia bacterium]|nr:IPT/TIG domain-containing protein [Bacteroidia bacterium]
MRKDATWLHAAGAMLVGILLSVLLAGCVTEFTRWDADIFIHTGEVTDITDSSAVFHGQILAPDASEVQEYGFVWDEGAGSTAVDAKRSLGSSPGPEPFRAVIESDMRAGVQYHVRAFARIRSGIVYGNSVRFTSEGYNESKITSISPQEGAAGTVVLIEGVRFCTNQASLQVYFGNSQALILEATSTFIRAEVPDPPRETGAVQVRVSCNGETTYAPVSFTLLKLKITGISPRRTFAPGMIRIGVQHMSMLDHWTAGLAPLDGQPYEIDLERSWGWTADTIRFAVNAYVPMGRYALWVRSPYQGTVWSPDTVTILSEWEQIAAYPGPRRCNPLSFSVSGQVYVTMDAGLYSSVDMSRLWRYDPVQNDWNMLSQFPGGYRYQGIAFTRGNQAYLAGGRNNDGDFPADIWSYDPGSDTWLIAASYPGPLPMVFGFGIGSKIYVGSWGDSTLLDFWEYDTGTLQWTERSMQGYDFVPEFPVWTFTARGKGYVFAPDALLEYSPASGTWTARAAPPDGLTSSAMVIHDTKVYVAGQQDNASRLHVYDLDVDAWSVYQRHLPGGAIGSVLSAPDSDTGYLLLAGPLSSSSSGCGTYCFRHDSLP